MWIQNYYRRIIDVHISLLLLWWVMFIIIFGLLYFFFMSGALTPAGQSALADPQKMFLENFFVSFEIATGSASSVPLYGTALFLSHFQQSVSLLFVVIFILKIAHFVRRGVHEPMERWH